MSDYREHQFYFAQRGEVELQCRCALVQPVWFISSRKQRSQVRILLRAFLRYTNPILRLCEFLRISRRIFRDDGQPHLERVGKFAVLRGQRKVSSKSRHPDHFFDSPPTGPPVGFFVFGADFEVELAHLQCRRESTVFAFPSVFPMISRQILR